MEHQQNQPPQGGVPGPTGRRLHIAHRRSPSELTPLMSMFSSPGMEQLAIQQQIELLQQQQQQIQATHQQYVNMGMIPPTQHLAPSGGYNPLQPQMQNLSPQNAFQFPNQMQQQQQQQMNAPMGAPTQPLSHRRNQSALPNMGMGPPPAPSSGASGSNFGDFGGHNRENIPARGGRGGGPPGGGHQRRHSLALPEAKKAAEIAQQKRTTSGFQFPIPGATGATPTERTDSPSGEDKNGQGQSTSNYVPTGSSVRGRGSGSGHGRSQSLAVGANGRGGSAIRGGGSFQFPPSQATPDAGAGGQQGNDFQRRGSATGHNRNSSRNFEGNWRNQPQGPPPQDQQGGMGNFQQQQGAFQPGHRNRGSMNQSINSIGSFQYGGQPQLVQLPQGQMALVQQPLYPGQQLNPLQMNQLQALQAAQMNGHVGLQGSQHAPQLSAQQQQQQRKTLFTPYLPQATLPALLGDGQLVSGILRVNKKNRSDAYVSTQDGLLDADIFICGSKDRNRALEGDLVAVELLDVDEVWGQKREKEEKKKRKDITDTRTSGSTNGNADRAHRDNSTNGDEQSGTGEGGIRRRGSLRQRPTQKKNDDVEVEGQSLLLVEEEEVNDALFVLLEAALCFAFWAVMKMKGGDFYVFGILPLCSWDVEDLEYTGLCSHNPLEEQIGVADFSLSPQDLEALKELRRLRTNNTVRTAQNLRAATAIADKTYHRSPCNRTFSKKTHFEAHQKKQSHLQKAAGIPKSKSQKEREKQFAKNVKAKLYYCAPCNYAAQNQQALDGHFQTKRHLKEQKPLYAGHIVAVIERVAGQMFSGTLGLLRPSSQATKEKQEAERQARDGNNGRHQEQRQQDKPKIVWFKPTDKRVPLIAIPTEQAPRDFVEKHQDYADRIFVACIKRWPITSLHPFGTLVEQLGKMGELKVETDALLRDNNFASDEFSDAVTRSVGLDEWSMEKEDAESLAARRDFRNEKTFTVDPNGANELDDAIHVKTEGDGKIEIGIHIADVAHFIKANSLVDREAKKRGTAVYLMNRSCNMLPPKIASEICSLVPGKDRLTVSVVFKVNAHTGSVYEDETWIGKSIIKSAGKLTYKEVDTVLSGHLDTKLEGAEVKDIQILHAIAQKWREQRLGTDGETIAPLRLIYQIDDENVPVEQNIFDSTPSHELIEELMHKANSYVAHKIAKGLPEKALLRRQGPPNPRRLQTFADRMNKIGYAIDTTSSGTLQNSLFKVDDTNIRKGMETLLIKTMHRAKYYIAGKTPQHLYPHYALNLPLYTHFTNPSRRYADLVVHRQLESVLTEGKIEYTEDIETLVKTTESCNTKKDSAQNAQEQSVHIESCRIMDRKREEVGGELISEGIVLCVYDSAFDVLIPEYGFEKRVHCDQLPLKKAEFRKNERILELYWEKGVPSSAYVPEDERPKPGASQRTTNAAAAAKQAAVAERAKKEHEEAQRKQMETGTMSTDDVDALFDDEDDVSDIADGIAGVSLAERPTQSVPPSPTKNSLTASGSLHRTRSDSKVHAGEPVEAKLSAKEKYLKFFALREENGEYIQDVKEMTRVPVILKTDLTKSPPCLTIRSINPYAL